MEYYIRNMVCRRCIFAVEQAFEQLDVSVESISLGKVVTKEPLSSEQSVRLQDNLQKLGFELIEDNKGVLIEKIKIVIIELIHHRKDLLSGINLSDYLEKEIGKDYHSLSILFSSSTGTTIEKFAILQKIERAKELLAYNEWSTSEIAYELGYSSVAHFSSQFKRITGLTPGHFRKIGENRRKPLDSI